MTDSWSLAIQNSVTEQQMQLFSFYSAFLIIIHIWLNGGKKNGVGVCFLGICSGDGEWWQNVSDVHPSVTHNSQGMKYGIPIRNGLVGSPDMMNKKEGEWKGLKSLNEENREGKKYPTPR